MQSIPTRSLSRAPRPTHVAPMFTIILYGVGPDVVMECEGIANEMHIARAEVKHLQAACMALKAHPQAFLIASATIRPWDREVLEEHAARAGTTLRWVSSPMETDDIGAAVRAWATGMMRRSRAAR